MLFQGHMLSTKDKIWTAGIWFIQGHQVNQYLQLRYGFKMVNNAGNYYLEIFNITIHPS